MLLFLIYMFFCIGCNKQKNTQVIAPEPEQIQNSLLDVTVEQNEPKELAQVMEEIMIERRKQIEGMNILEMVDFFIDREYLINVGINDENNHAHILGYFSFSSRESIQWFSDTSGPRYFPYLFIIDEDNLRIEIFTYFGSAEKARIGNYCSTRKYYIDINNDQLINYYLRIKRQIDTYVTTAFFKANITEEQEKERGGFFFKVLKDAPLYTDTEMEGTELGTIFAGDMVKVIDIHYQDLSDKYPVAVKVEIGDLSGWVDLHSVDFIFEM